MIVSGKDGKIIKRKGDPIFIAQNMAYLYNDKDQKTEIKDVNKLNFDILLSAIILISMNCVTIKEINIKILSPNIKSFY